MSDEINNPQKPGNGDGLKHIIDELTNEVSNHVTSEFLKEFQELREALDMYHQQTRTKIEECEDKIESYEARIGQLEKTVADLAGKSA